MGLAGPRKKVKLSHDPNNTTWTRDTAGFGHKMMISQGWQPGEYLGAKDAAHAEFHTAANASFIRVALKDDNLGIGAKKGSGLNAGECTGLDVFQTLLGRLNGRDEDVMEKEQKSREDLKRAIYAEKKWGSIRFVRGGLLIGDKIQDLIEGEAERVRKLGDESGDKKETVVKHEPRSSSEPEIREKRVKKDKKSKKRSADAVKEEEVEQSLVDFARPKSKKSKKNKDSSETDEAESEEARAERKKEKKRRKREQRDVEEAVQATEAISKESKKKSKRSKKDDGEPEQSSEELKSRLPSPKLVDSNPSSGTITPQSLMGGRHAVRSRNIAQKRLAVMDTASLNQIFMIKQ